jgi:hypothetical protein
MTELADLGFEKGVIVETVVSTYGRDGQPNAAPMGATMEQAQRVVFKIYKSSSTYNNLQAKRCAVMNVTSNAEVFYRTAFKEANPEGKIPTRWFEKAITVVAPRLRAANAHVEVTVLDVSHLDEEKAGVTCEAKLVHAVTVLPQAYCRASFAAIEAIIHATRVNHFLMHGDRAKQEQAVDLMEKIKDCQDVVNRVAPNSRYSEIMKDLTRRIDSWRAKK